MGDVSSATRVLFCIPRLVGGGAESHLVRLLHHLDRSKIEPSVVSLLRTEGAELLPPDVVLHRLSHPAAPSTLLRVGLAVPRLRELLLRDRPDVVCSLLEPGNVAMLMAADGLPHGPARVISVQNTLSAKYVTSPRRGARLLFRLARKLYPTADRVLAVSHGVAGDYLRLMGPGVVAPQVIQNAVTDAELLRAATAHRVSRPSEPLLVACGRLTRQKGFDHLLEALVRLRRNWPAHLWIVGEGEERPALEQQIARLGLADCVRLLGFERNPFPYMAAADVFVLSSRWEGFGNVVVEAMACGAPVVATRTHGPSEIVVPGTSGLLVEPEQPAALAAAIESVLADRTLRQGLAQAGRERAAEYEAARVARRYEEAFRDLASERRVAA